MHRSTIEETLLELRQGRMVILVEEEHREQEGDLVLAAEKVTPEAINFMLQFARGLVCLTLADSIISRLQIPLMEPRFKKPHQAAFTYSIEARRGISTGVSVYDRAETIRVAADPKSTPNDISIPGHVFPLRADPGGLSNRQGHTEASIELMKLANLQPAAVICEIMREDGTMAHWPDLIKFGKRHHLKVACIRDLIAYLKESRDNAVV